MMKFVVLAVVICATNAGFIGTGLSVGVGGLGGGNSGGIGYGNLGGFGLGGIGYGHGVAVAAPIAVKTALASSYQNNNQVSLYPTAVVAKAVAPIAVAAPVAIAAPVSVGYGLGGLGGGLGGNGVGVSGIGGYGLKGLNGGFGGIGYGVSGISNGLGGIGGYGLKGY